MLEILINSTVALTACVTIILLLKWIFKDKMTPEWHFSVWLVLVPFLLLMTVPAFELESNFSLRSYLPRAENVGYYSAPADGSGSAGNDMQGSGKTDVVAGTDGSYGAGEVGTVDGSEQVSDEGMVFVDGELKNADDVPGYLEVVPDGQELPLGKRPVARVNLPGDAVFSISRSAEVTIVSVWALGVLVVSGVQVVRYVRLRRSLAGLQVCEDPEILKIYEECREILKIRKDIPLKVGADSSMLAGVFRRTIYIKEGTSKEELKYVLMHELCHYKLGDVAANLAAAACFALSWFNPVIWIAFRTFRRDIEIRCDSVAITRLGSRREYAEVLVRAAAGQSGFVLASTSFLGGEKEVATRVKRIVNTRKRKIALEVVATVVITFFVVACASVPAPGKTESVKVGESRQIDVPASWISDMRTEEESKYFFDKNGEMFAVAYIPDSEEIFSYGEWLYLAGGIVGPHGEYSEGDAMSDETICQRIYDEVSSDFAEKGFTNIVLKDFSVNESGSRHLMIGADYGQTDAIGLGQDGTGTKSIPATAYNIAVQQLGVDIVAIAADEEHANELELVEMLMSFRSIGRMSSGDADVLEMGGIQIVGIEEFANLPEGSTKPELSDVEYEKYAERTLRDALEWYILGDYPVEIEANGYEITGMERVSEAVGSGSSGSQSPMIDYWYRDDARWDIIYPHARVYKVSFELTPYNEKYFEGPTHYEDVYAVFAVNDYVAVDDYTGQPQPETHLISGMYADHEVASDFYFLGLVQPGNVSAYGLDVAVLGMLDSWYMSLNPMTNEDYTTEYIGDAQAVGRIVNSLPLKEYIWKAEGTFSENAIMIQTAEEPYGITITYRIDRKLPNVTDEIALTPLTPREETVLDAPINAYVANQVQQNINQLYARIGNLDEVTINVRYVSEDAENENQADATYTVHTTRDNFYL